MNIKYVHDFFKTLMIFFLRELFQAWKYIYFLISLLFQGFYDRVYYYTTPCIYHCNKYVCSGLEHVNIFYGGI